MKKGILILAILLMVSSGCKSVSTLQTGEGWLALINGTLIDGTGAEPVKDAVLLIEGKYIRAAGPRSSVKIPPNVRVIDVSGATILPGFINAHVHDAYDGDRLQAWARAGVTTVRDESVMSGDHGQLSDLLERRDSQWSGPQYARLVSAGFMIAKQGGYGRITINGVEEARQKTEYEIHQGAQLIKISMETGYAAMSGLPVLTDDELRAIIDMAHARGRRVTAHVTQAQYLRQVVEAGVDDAAHMPYDWVPDEVFQTMIDRNIYVVPTMTVFEAYGALAGMQANLSRFVQMGGKVAMGNDYTYIPQNGFDQFELGMPMHELTHMQGAGMTPMQIIVASTLNGAHVIGLEQELGSLEPGKMADVLVVNGDPLADLVALLNVKLVLHGGEIVRP